MNKLFRFFMYFMMPVVFGLVLSCKDDEGDTTPTPTPDPDPVEEPTITSVAPAEGEPGTEVVITGTNLEDAEVTFGDFEATVTANTATSITTTVPDDATAGAQNITVTTEGGTATFDFTVTEEAAEEVITITSFTPATGPVGTQVTVTGTNLDLATGATIGETTITDWDPNEEGTSATFTIPTGAETGAITLTPEEGDAVVSADEFTVEEGAAGPTIVSFTPATGPIGTQVTVTGTNLDLVTGATMGDVDIADWDANDEGTSATFTIPTGAATGTFTLTTDAGDEIESETEFTVEEAGSGNVVFESTFDPVTGPAASDVTVTASDDTDFTGATSVWIGETVVETFTVADDGRSITLTLPEEAVSGPLMFETEDGMYESNAVFAFGTNVAGEAIYTTGTGNTAYTDAVESGWQLWNGWNATNDPASTDMEGTTAIRVDYEASGEDGTGGFGGLQFHPEPVIALDGSEFVVLSIYGAVGASDVWLYIKDDVEVADEDKVTLDVVEGEWRTYVVPVSAFTNNPDNVNELAIQNSTGDASTIYVDNVMLIQ